MSSHVNTNSPKKGGKDNVSTLRAHKILKRSKRAVKNFLKIFCVKLRHITYVSRVRRLEGALQSGVGGQMQESNREEDLYRDFVEIIIVVIFLRL